MALGTGGLLRHLGGDGEGMPFLGHLEELRKIVLRAIGGFLLATIVSYVFSGIVLDELIVWLRQFNETTDVVFTQVQEPLNARLKVAFLMGLILSLPFILWQIWGFVVPGLLKKERKLIAPVVFWSALLFYSGIAFSYFVLTPLMVKVLAGFATEHMKDYTSIASLLNFAITMATASGILFQLPLVVALLSMIGILKPSFLIKRWRHAVVGIMLLTAVITPGDGPSQIILGIPVLILYFASIFVAQAIWRGKKEKEETAQEPAEETSAPPQQVEDEDDHD